MHEAPTKKDKPDTQNTAPVFDFTVDELRAAFEGIGDRKKPGIDLITKESYAADLEGNLVHLQRELREGTYAAQHVLRVLARKPGGGRRPIAFVCTVDKIVQRALLQRLEPRLSHVFSDRSFARAGWGTAVAADQLFIDLMRHRPRELVRLDIKKFYENIDHDRLLRMLKPHTSSAELALMGPMIKCRVFADVSASIAATNPSGEEDAEPDLIESTREIGIEQGMPISMLLANLFLHHALDEWLDAQIDVASWVRFLDDIVVCLEPHEEHIAAAFKDRVSDRVVEYGLELNDSKSEVVTYFDPDYVRTLAPGECNSYFGVDFLGLRIRPMVTKSGSYFVQTLTNSGSSDLPDDLDGR